MFRSANLKDFDWAMLFIVLVVCGLGVLQIFSATQNTIWQGAWWKQLAYVILGVGLMWAVASFDYHLLLQKSYTFYIASVVLLLVVLLFGKTTFGSTRWIQMPGGLRFQVSEFTKLVIILLVARFLTDLRAEVLEFREMLQLGGLILVPMALVAKEPDLGTALTYLPIFAVGAFLSGLRWKYWVTTALVALVLIPVGYGYLKPYQKSRIVSFLDPERDPHGDGYQLIQSKIAVGAGGTWGKGVTKGTQTQLRFLPVPHTDFIFSAYAEEHGFVGVIFVLVLYFILLMQVVQSAQTAPDRAGMYICMGVGSLLLFHILVNVGMVVGRMPVTGIPLPLMSYGGSSIWSTFLMLGLVNSVRVRRFVN
ncbi:MAG: rod shape-determining protein RodA [Acidobacteriia bacterium]|nr:rod shape-determining protein RodA [Terriglobia bacterium]